VDGSNRFGLVSAFLAKHYGGVVGHGPERPIGTITAIDHHSVAAASLARIGQTGGNGKYTNGVDEPITTVVSKAEHCLVAAHLSKFYGTNVGADAGAPLPTITGQGNHIGEVRAFLTKYFGSNRVGQECVEPLHTITAVDRFGLVTVGGEDYAIADIGLRMLTPRELYRAQGFPDDYRIEVAVGGKPLPKSSQVRMCGNSVCPPVAEALVRANMGLGESSNGRGKRLLEVAS
jgi:DNA (cytosine-5)-methyltransferase 1